MDKYNELVRLVTELKPDMVKIFEKGNKTAGVRVRKKMQDLKELAQEIRDRVQLVKTDKTD